MKKFKIMSGQISIEATDLSNTESVRKFIASGGVLKYTVQPGDTLSEIAFYCGLDYQHLAAINNIDNPNHISSGMDLRISKQKGDGVVVTLVKAEDFKPTEEFKLAQANLSDEMMSTPTHPFGSLEFRLKWHKLLENVDTATINAPIQIVRAPESKFKIVYSITQDDTVYDSYDRASMEVEKWLYKNIGVQGYTYFETDPKDDPDGLTYGMLRKNLEDDCSDKSWHPGQGLIGKRIESAYRVMTNWQERLKTIDLSKVSAPFSIMLTFEKKWLISYSSNEDSVVVDTYDDVLINISNWLIANKTESLSQQ